MQKLLLVLGSSQQVAVNVVNVSHISPELESFVVPCNSSCNSERSLSMSPGLQSILRDLDQHPNCPLFDPLPSQGHC